MLNEHDFPACAETFSYYKPDSNNETHDPPEQLYAL